MSPTEIQQMYEAIQKYLPLFEEDDPDWHRKVRRALWDIQFPEL